MLPFADSTFDFVYAHGVVQYAADDAGVVSECHRVLRPGGTAMFQVYNRISWLHVLSKVMKTPLEHEDAPVLRRYSIGEFRALLAAIRRRRDHSRTVPGEEPPAQGLEGRGLQRRCSSARSTPSRAPGSAASAGTCSRSAQSRSRVSWLTTRLAHQGARLRQRLPARAGEPPGRRRRSGRRSRGRRAIGIAAIGADGLMLVEATPAGATTRLFNADGSRSEVSGNGVRCVAAWLAETRSSRRRRPLEIETGAGAKHLTLLGAEGAAWRFRADMGAADRPARGDDRRRGPGGAMPSCCASAIRSV